MANIDRIKLPDNSEYDLQARVIGAVNGNVAVMDGNGNVADGGKALGDLAEQDEVNAIFEVYGSKNIFKYPYSYASGSPSGITWTANEDGSVTLSGTAAADVYIPLRSQSDGWKIPSGEYKLTGKNASNNVQVVLQTYSGTTYVSTLVTAVNDNDYTFTPSYSGYDRLAVFIKVPNGAVVSTPVTIYPMIRDSRIADDTYVPYAMTNRELTQGKVNTDAIAPTEDGTTASKAYAVGEHFIRGGKYCVCIAAITSGGTFTLNTNYIETQIGALPSKHIINYMVGNALSSVVADGNGTCTFPIYLPFVTSITKNVTIAVTGQLRVHKAGGGYSDVTLSATGFLQGNILSLVVLGLDANAVYSLDSATGGTITITF